MIILSKCLIFLKKFACNGCFGLFSKIKKGSGASFWGLFSAWFFHKNVPYLVLYQWTKFQCHTLFLSQDIKQNVLLKLVCAIFYQISIFSSNDRPSKTMKNGFYFIEKSSFHSWDIQIFVTFSLSKLSIFKRANGSGIVYDVINWLP